MVSPIVKGCVIAADARLQRRRSHSVAMALEWIKR
jgi:hypothetical protein